MTRAYRKTPPEVRFWRHVSVDTETKCWNWTATLGNGGYGQFWVERLVKSHVWSYERSKGPVPSGLELDHVCRNPSCVNPDHLEAVTRSENMLRIPRPTRCRKCGNEYPPKINGRRRCKTCSDAYQANYRKEYR